MRHKKIVSYTLVGMQFVLLFAIAMYSGIWRYNPDNFVFMLALGLGLWAFASMRYDMSVLPDVREHQPLHIGGAYRFVRHPMYSALLLATLAWVGNRLDYLSVGLWLMLFVVLNIKLRYEEQQLRRRFKTYGDYAMHTKRLIPYVY